MHRRERGGVIGDLLDHQLEQRAVDPHAAMPFGQRNDADRQRHPALHHRLRRPAPRRLGLGEQDELGGAAADVEQDDAARLRIHQRRAAGGGEVGLGLAVDDLELDADALADDGEELGAVLGGAASFRGDQAGAGHRPVAHLVPADSERRHRAGDRGIGQPPGRRDALAEPDDAGKRVDHTKAVAGRPRDQQAAIVGAEVEGGVGLAFAFGGGAEPALAMKPAAPPSHAPVGPRPIKPEVEVTGCPALVIHCVPFHRAEVSFDSTASGMFRSSHRSVTVLPGAATHE